MRVAVVNYKDLNAPELFSESLKNTGFAVLTHHPVNMQLIDSAYQKWKEFFSSADKAQYTYQKPSQQGYFPFKTENAKNNKTSDLKEFYHFYLGGKIPQELQDISTSIYKDLHNLARNLLQWIEDYLPQDVSKKLAMPLKDMIIDSPNTLLRILHYPPLQENQESALRAAPHEDINLITLLPAATAPGLEVLDTQGNWHEVNCNPGNMVVNVGDMLQMCTEFYYKSTTHRVVNPVSTHENCSRYSMPLFLHPRNEVQLSKTHTAIEYRHERLREIGIY